MRPPYPLRHMSAKDPEAARLKTYATQSFGPYGNLTGMRRNYGWQNAKPVKIGAYVYDATGVYTEVGGVCLYDVPKLCTCGCRVGNPSEGCKNDRWHDTCHKE